MTTPRRWIRAIGGIGLAGLAVLIGWLYWSDRDPVEPPLTTGASVPGSSGALALEQGWGVQTVERAWYSSFGSRLLPRAWFLALEQADSDERFSSSSHLASFGFLPQTVSPRNPDGLPVGFAISGDGAEAYVGLTCAACHTGELRYAGRRLRIVGGAGMVDISAFENALMQSLQATTAEGAKFSRFASRVGDAGNLHGELDRWSERFARRVQINRVDVPYGPGRMDAFGQIFNVVSADFLGLPDNFHAPDAPVSIPSLWNTPKLDRVQWNGSSPNAGPAPLVQNVTTALAVYGDIDLSAAGWLGYPSSVDVTGLGHLQRWNTRLRSPQWPEAWLGKLDRSAVARGREVYFAHCLRCHVIADRADATQALQATLVPLGEVGTDPRMAENFAQRRVDAGSLAGRRAMFWGGELIRSPARSIDLVTHVALGATSQHPLLALRAMLAGAGSAGDAGDAGTLGYKAGPLAGIWATAPYLHNGSVPTLYDLLLPSARRPTGFAVGSGDFDPDKIGLRSSAGVAGSHFDTTLPGNHNDGHEYGTTLDSAQKSDLLQFLKSL